MNKFQFIQHLMETKRFTPSQKERFLKLASQEIGLIKPSNEELWEEIIKIKEKLGYNGDGGKEKTIVVQGPDGEPAEAEVPNEFGKIDVERLLKGIDMSSDVQVYESGNRLSKNEKQKTQFKSIGKHTNLPEPNPKHVADFMSLFNKRDGLKYLTHDYDENTAFDIDKFLISANKVFNKETYKKLNIPKSLWRIVKQFAFDSKQTEWTSISKDYKKSIPIKIGWATKELRNWSKQNNLHPIRNKEYEKIINDFKRITRIESSNLEKLIDATLESTFENEIDNFKINKIDLSKADFYSHIGFLKLAFEIIFEEIKRHSDFSQKKNITIKYERSISEDGYYLRKIVIKHHKSLPNKELGVLLEEWQEKGNMGKIKEKLRGYCHWSVETKIEGTPTRVNILRENKTVAFKQIEYDPDGFTHILTFYYK